MKILISRLPRSGKTTLATPFAELIGGVHPQMQMQLERLTKTGTLVPEGRIRQAQRMRHLADGVVMGGKIGHSRFCLSLQKEQDKNLL